MVDSDEAEEEDDEEEIRTLMVSKYLVYCHLLLPLVLGGH